jgi:hypothetical protein
MKTPRAGRLLGGLLAAAVLVTAALVAPALSLAGNAQVTFFLSVRTNCVEGHGPVSSTLHLVWRSSGGALKGAAVVTTNSVSGYWSYCSTDGTLLANGDRLKATIGSYVRKYTVPPVTLHVDRVTDTFHGTAPAGTPLTLWYISGGCCADFEQHADLVADSAGTWSFDEDYPTDRFHGRVEWNSPKGDFVQVEDQAPALGVVIGRSTVGVDGDPYGTLRVVLRNGETGARKGVARGMFDQYGTFEGNFLNAAGNPVNVAVGDKIDGTSLVSDMKFRVRDIQVSADVATDVVDGRCINPSTSGMLTVTRDGHRVGFAVFGLEEDGTFSIWMGGDETLGYDPANIHRGDKVRVTCFLNQGDAVTKNFVVR